MSEQQNNSNVKWVLIANSFLAVCITVGIVITGSLWFLALILLAHTIKIVK